MKTLKITAILFAAMSFISCKKETNVSPGGTGNIEQTTEHEKPYVASDWFQLNIAQSESFTKGYHQLDEPINLNNKPFELLLFARIPGASGNSYKMVPHKEQMIKSTMLYYYDPGNMVINVQYLVRNQTIMKNFSFRYFAVDVEYYHNAGIDWSDYTAVESLLSSHLTSQ